MQVSLKEGKGFKHDGPKLTIRDFIIKLRGGYLSLLVANSFLPCIILILILYGLEVNQFKCLLKNLD